MLPPNSKLKVKTMTSKEKANRYAVKHNLRSRKIAKLWAICGQSRAEKAKLKGKTNVK